MPGIVRWWGPPAVLAVAGCAAAPIPMVVTGPEGCAVTAAVDPARSVAGDPGLRDPRVTASVIRADGSVLVAYRPRKELGVGIRDASGGWTHLDPASSPMRSGRVRDLVADASGGVWFVYADGSAGVSRLSGTVLETFTPENSALPVADVLSVCAEPAGEGPEGDAVWCVTVDGLTRWLPGNVWTHYGRSHGQATEALRLLGLDEWLTRTVVGIRDLVAGGGQLWVATARRVHRFDGTVFAPLPDDVVRGLSDLRYDRLIWAGGAVWATLRHRDSRRVEGVVRWRPGGAAWTWLAIEAAGEPAAERIRLTACGDRAWLTSPGWRGRALVAGPEDARWSRIGPVKPAGGPGGGAIE